MQLSRSLFTGTNFNNRNRFLKRKFDGTQGHREVRIFSLWPKRRTAVNARCSGHNLSLPFKALYNNTLTYDYSLRSQRGTVTNAREWGRNSVESCGCLRNEDLIKYRHVCMIITGESYSAR